MEHSEGCSTGTVLPVCARHGTAGAVPFPPAYPSWKWQHCWRQPCLRDALRVSAHVLPPGSDEDRREWPDSLPPADEGEPLEVGAGQRTARLQERQARVHHCHTETPCVSASWVIRLGQGQAGIVRRCGLWGAPSRAGCSVHHYFLCLLKEQP